MILKAGPLYQCALAKTPVNTQGRWYSLMAFTMLP
jgi:hypothetical protein